ncbi:uncharacterized protein LDX57_001144 [Aspergillus melleus]|uniref:uncharacterized protein n=1 Tax=Aspergillus melleus TaxID=138277 RepID=UPI001E8E31C1|nr:uncharacterized protein LDX57_001144 [Aspergillus melleus]KAH8423386.1 hypothetical protein LDX57_001144 [Aspergillus melleus]
MPHIVLPEQRQISCKDKPEASTARSIYLLDSKERLPFQLRPSTLFSFLPVVFSWTSLSICQSVSLGRLELSAFPGGSDWMIHHSSGEAIDGRPWRENSSFIPRALPSSIPLMEPPSPCPVNDRE